MTPAQKTVADAAPAETRKGPVEFVCAQAEAHRVDDEIKLEFVTPGNMRMIWKLGARAALNFAHQIERAFHQENGHGG